ncbi:hypothetical protein MRI28_11790 [Nocardiopsis dassonvillei]|uniref:hypothetical protein n=1 Tax=Nocardiopsis dassonvillei TaxID=2014 RepID=UPI00200DCA1E|nr:hypothetical protein [Nocardiopsis dassonvillei]MCK9870313.1 hypothetical protein [Nocardiopsis dassonvillei]
MNAPEHPRRTRPENVVEVWVLHDRTRPPEEQITLWTNKTDADLDRANRIRDHWERLRRRHDIPLTPPDDPALVTAIYDRIHDMDLLPAPQRHTVGSTRGPKARFYWADNHEGGDTAVEIDGIVVGARREPEGLCVWVASDGADDTWPQGEDGDVPVQIVVNDGPVWEHPPGAWSAVRDLRPEGVESVTVTDLSQALSKAGQECLSPGMRVVVAHNGAPELGDPVIATEVLEFRIDPNTGAGLLGENAEGHSDTVPALVLFTER